MNGYTMMRKEILFCATRALKPLSLLESLIQAWAQRWPGHLAHLFKLNKTHILLAPNLRRNLFVKINNNQQQHTHRHAQVVRRNHQIYSIVVVHVFLLVELKFGRACILFLGFLVNIFLEVAKSNKALALLYKTAAQDWSNASWFSGVEPTFITTGFRNWKKANEKLDVHKHSQFHNKNVNLIYQQEKTQPVSEILDSENKKEQQIARKCLLTITSTLKFLMKSGLEVRGHYSVDGNFMELLREQQMDVPELNQWLKRTNYYIHERRHSKRID